MDTPFPTLSHDFLNPSGDAATAVALEAATTVAISPPAFSPAPSPSPAAQTLPATGNSSSSAQTLRDTLALALELAPQVMDNLVGRALLGMDRQSTAHPDADQRNLLDSAAVQMDGHRRRWGKQFAALLRVACAHPLSIEQAARLPVADVRICATELEQLNALMQSGGSLRGNPLEPQIYVRAIGELLARSEGKPEQRHIWGNFLLGALGTQLAWVYLQLNANLRTPGSRETSALAREADFESYAAYVFGLGGSVPPDLEPAPPAPPAYISPEMRALADEAKRTVKKMRAVLGLPDTQAGEMPELAGDEMGRMMRDIEESERLMVLMQERGLQMPEDESPEQVSQKRHDKIDRMLSEYRNASNAVLQRLPQSVKEVLLRFQTPLVRLAEQDTSVLTRAEHPARLLLQAIVERGLQIGGDMQEVLTPFTASISKLADALDAVAQPTANVFEQAVGKMQAAWERLDEVIKQAEDRKEISLAQLGVRKQLASRLAFELVSRSDASDAPVPIKQFLMGPWAQVLARAQLHPQYPQDEQRYGYAATLLLWSVSVRRAGAHKQRMVERAADLMAALRVGLASVDLSQGEIDASLLEIKRLQEAVIASDIDVEADEDSFPPEPPSTADLSDMMQLGAAIGTRTPPPAPSAPSYQSDLNLL